ncbi:MAG: (d)CMP kinase [Schleiferiaceae bacterium]|jgi:cytidylate kinase|nr:(d)CMP kinase [Schleiferiaceae bacterium]MDG1880810.1 (d)CMP kinase [Schleiferiaceae bacterium]
MVIAIDGYSSTGKSSLAKKLASQYGFLYIDTGAMYRMVALKVLREGWINSKKEISDDLLERNLPLLNIDFKRTSDGKNLALLDGEVVEIDIRTMEINDIVSKISSLTIVRSQLVAQQQKMAIGKDLVMDGRDIGTVVFPNADLKIFMQADADIRANRRLLELRSNGNLNVSLEEVRANLIQRDSDDQARSDSPLQKASDAVVLDNSEKSAEEVFKLVSSWVLEKINT